MTDRRKAQKRSYMAKRYAHRRAFLDWLKNQPCRDCGHKFPPFVMDFDHRDPAGKRLELTKWTSRGSAESLFVELVKCDVVCANCHRVRTWGKK